MTDLGETIAADSYGLNLTDAWTPQDEQSFYQASDVPEVVASTGGQDQKYAQGTAATTHVRIDGVVYPVGKMQTQLGFTFAQWERRKEVKAQRVRCTLGASALTLDEFEATHPHIHLGYN